MNQAMLRPGDIIEVKDAKSGRTYEAVIRWIPDRGAIRCEWIAGPNDSEDVWVEMERQEF